MNPQYLPPQQFGGPQHSFPSNGPTPALGPNVSLDSLKQGGSVSSQREPSILNQFPESQQTNLLGSLPSSAPGQFSPMSAGRYIPRSQLPPSQLPPPLGQNLQDTNNSFGVPPRQPDTSTGQFQNGPPSGPYPPVSQQNKEAAAFVPSNQNVPQENRNQFGLSSVPTGPPLQNTKDLPRPPSNQSNQLDPQLTRTGPSQFGQPGGLVQTPASQFGQPPLRPPLPNQSQYSHPPQAGPLPNQVGQAPVSGGPPRQGQSMMQPPMGQNFNPRPPVPGQAALGQGPPGNFNPGSGPYPYQYPPGPQIPGGPQMPPPQSQPPPEQIQLANQVQGLHLGGNMSGPRQYPGGPMRGAINGDNMPHMPPLPNKPGYVNGQQGSVYPPMPSQGYVPPGQGLVPSGPGGGYPQPNYQQQQQQQQQARRLDPDQMPSPIQVTQDDQQSRSGVFVTNQKGAAPPLVTTNFVVEDQGNASPRLIRSTMYNVPISQDIIKQTAVPFSVVISPMAKHIDQEYPPPIVNFGELGPVRCNRCKAYMCPYMQFIDSGRRFQCLFCKATTDVPTDYFQHLDHTGQRMDRFERPELVLGTYEFVATADYCRNNTLPKPPAVIFIIDVSYNNIKSGMVNLLCSKMKNIIENLPVDQGQQKSNMKVGFITYNSSVHFYNIKGSLAAPQMMVVGDVQEMFMPLLDGFLSTPEESSAVIDDLMNQIPAMFADTRETETILLPAIQAGLEALKASECAGKLMVFHSTLPSAEAPGKLKNREDRKLLGTEKEKTVLTPQNQSYNQLGQDCVGAGCSVDLFIFNNSYIDLATIGQVSRLTGGEIFKYTYFQADIDGERVISDVIMDISRPIAFDGVMRLRTSTGVRPTDFYGHFFMSNTTDVQLAAVDCDKAVAIEIKHDDKLSEDEGVYIQSALLYTSCSGQRRLRIMNLSLKTCSQMADLYRSCDLDTIINYISKQAVYKLLENNPKAVKDYIVNRAAQILATYRKNCASPSSAGQLILPECMKLLPLYVNCLLKSDALVGGSDMTIDDRSFVMQAVMIMDIPTSVHYFYPRLIPLHDLDYSEQPVAIPAPIRCTFEKMNEQGVYILENGIHMFLWFGLGVNPDYVQKLFGVSSAIQVDIDRVGLPELDNPLSLAVRSIIEEIRIQRHRCMRLTIVRQREKLEPVFKHFLVEDRGTDGSPSYVDFLCHMHKEIRTLLS